MRQTIQRYQIADYLNIGTDEETYELMGAGLIHWMKTQQPNWIQKHM